MMLWKYKKYPSHSHFMLSCSRLIRQAGIANFKREVCKTRFFNVTGAMASPDYSAWNAEQLVAKVQALEKDLKEANERSDPY